MLHQLFTPGYLIISAIIVLWDILMTGRIVQLQTRVGKRSFAAFATVTAFAGLLIAPAILIAIAAATSLWGRAIQMVAWLWPFTALLFVLQGIISLGRGVVSPLFGVPVLAYNTVIAAAAVTRYLNSLGYVPAEPLLVLTAAQASALGVVGGLDALWKGVWLQVPLLSPAMKSRWKVGTAVRAVLSITVVGLMGFVVIGVPGALEAVRSYNRYEGMQMQERPDGDLAVGLKILPDLRGNPPPVAARNDLALLDSLRMNVIEVVVDPAAARGFALDSLSRLLETRRGDSTILIVALGYPTDAAAQVRKSQRAYIDARLADVNRLARKLKPNHLIPAVEPYGRGIRALGIQPVSFWIEYITRASELAKHVNPNIRIGISASSYGARDSTLYAWAAKRGSPVNVLGFSFMPGFDGVLSLDTHLRIAQRWMREQGDQVKPHWVWGAGGLPIAHGEHSQTLAVWGILAWASAQPAIKGFIVREGGDYDTQLGVRAATGRRRQVVSIVERAMLNLRGSGPR
jgi:hypothetical protein